MLSSVAFRLPSEFLLRWSTNPNSAPFTLSVPCQSPATSCAKARLAMLSTMGISIRVAFINPPVESLFLPKGTLNLKTVRRVLLVSCCLHQLLRCSQIIDHPLQTACRAGVQSPGKQEKRSDQPVPECEYCNMPWMKAV